MSAVESETRMRAVAGGAENFKGLTNIEFLVGPLLTVIGGENEQGKSSVLDIFAAALGGDKLCPDMPIKTGQQTAKVWVDLEGNHEFLPNCRVRRTWWRGKDAEGKEYVETKLEVVAKNGYKIPSPQSVLLSIIDKFALDPIIFSELKEKDQAERLRKVMGIDTSVLDARYKQVYDSRTEVGRDGVKIKAQYEAVVVPANVPAEKLDVQVLMADLKAKNATNIENKKNRDALDNTRKMLAKQNDIVTAAREVLRSAEAELLRLTGVVNDQQQKVEILIDEDITAVEKKINDSQTLNNAFDLKVKKDSLKAERDKLTTSWRNKEVELAEIKQEKGEMLAKAKWPIEGLSFSEDMSTVLYNLVPLSQVNDATQINISCAIEAAAKPTLRMIFIRRGSLLDNKRTEHVARYAAERGFQVLLERVSEGPECNIVIESGSIKRIDDAFKTDDMKLLEAKANAGKDQNGEQDNEPDVDPFIAGEVRGND